MALITIKSSTAYSVTSVWTILRQQKTTEMRPVFDFQSIWGQLKIIFQWASVVGPLGAPGQFLSIMQGGDSAPTGAARGPQRPGRSIFCSQKNKLATFLGPPTTGEWGRAGTFLRKLLSPLPTTETTTGTVFLDFRWMHY